MLTTGTHYTQLTVRTHTVQSDRHTDAIYTLQHVCTRGAARTRDAASGADTGRGALLQTRHEPDGSSARA